MRAAATAKDGDNGKSHCVKKRRQWPQIEAIALRPRFALRCV